MPTTPTRPTPTPLTNDLVLELHDTAVREETDANGNVLTRATARAVLAHQPSDGDHVRSEPFDLTSPIGPIEKDDLDWYLEKYRLWPTSVFRERARNIEERFPVWGGRIRDALVNDTTRNVFKRWQESDGISDRRFTVLTDDVNGGAAQLLSIPWELLHDGRDVLVQRCVRREERADVLPISAPIRVLLITARTGRRDVDHRVCARSLFDAFDTLGNLAEITVLQPATVNAMRDALERATAKECPYHVVHFDGHGRYDKDNATGGLVFENDATVHLAKNRRSSFCPAADFAAALKQFRVPVAILQACQTAATDTDVTASVAGRLNREGVPTVLAMSHSVLVETARRFFTVFYRELVSGVRVGTAMLKAQQELRTGDFRIHVFKHELRLQDWFVPVLFQDEDPVLVLAPPPEVLQNASAEERRLALGDVPEPPDHRFVGRSHELLIAERYLELEPYIVLRGEGGEGKTTFAVELVRWLVRIGRYERAAFVSLDHHPDAKAALYELGPQFDSGFVSKAAMDPDNATRLLQDALAGQRTLLVFDNMETVLADEDAKGQVLELANELLKVDGTRIVFTSREHLPAPFDENDVDISRLDRRDAVRIVANVLEQEDCVPYVEDEGESEDEIVQLVDAVQAHARSLVLLAPYVAERGVKATTEDMRGVLEEMEARHPGDRERSLFASVELSLRRLPEGMRERIRPLAAFHGGISVGSVSFVLRIPEPAKVFLLTEKMVDVGLAYMLPYKSLRLHPMLGPTLDLEMTDDERREARSSWVRSTVIFTSFLSDQRIKDVALSATLTLSDLPNILAVLGYLTENAPADKIIAMATEVEFLIQELGRPKAMAWITRLREEAASTLAEWGHTSFISRSATIDRLHKAGQVQEALNASHHLLKCCMAEGANAYPEAPYDLATAHFHLGRALIGAGDANGAIEPLTEARTRFLRISDSGTSRMARTCLTETGECLLAVGRLAEAEDVYERSFALDKEQGDLRGMAVVKLQLGTVRTHQKRFKDAIDSYVEARTIFEALGEPGSVASAWHQIGAVHAETGDHALAEASFQSSLRISVQQGDQSSQANTLNDIGLLYEKTGQLEEAIRFLRQAISIDIKMHNLTREGQRRNNIADCLFRLRCFHEARQEVLRAIECKELIGYAEDMWKTFHLLHNIERALGAEGAAAQAREKAVMTFIEYRRAGGENHGATGQVMAMVRKAFDSGETAQLASDLSTAMKSSTVPAENRPSLKAIVKILRGARDSTLAMDPELDYQSAVELILLLESLGEDGIRYNRFETPWLKLAPN
jgi:tetratricopeptide (TPR) repeat protein